MKKSFICSLLAVSMLAACATDPYTGESKVAKTAWGTGIGAAAGAGIGQRFPHRYADAEPEGRFPGNP